MCTKVASFVQTHNLRKVKQIRLHLGPFGAIFRLCIQKRNSVNSLNDVSQLGQYAMSHSHQDTGIETSVHATVNPVLPQARTKSEAHLK